MPDAGSTQGIGLGMLQGLARAGADVVMHGLVTPEQARQKQAEIEGEYGVKCGQSAANVMKPAEIRYSWPSCPSFKGLSISLDCL